jgi:Mrp family chromosome partitioning ATPase
MPSDRPPPEPPQAGSDSTGRRRTTSAVRDGTLVFALVLGGFVAYALGATATYRAAAVVAVETSPGSKPVALPKAADATERLRRAALDATVLASLVNEERPAAPETVAQASERIARSLSVESSDGRRFSFAATAPSAERAQRIVNELAQQAAKRAAQVLDPEPPPESDSGAKVKAELLDFIAAHPGIASEPAPAPTRSGPDPLVLALRAERTRIEQKLAHPERTTSENPYEDPKPLENPDQLRRRLREIENALEARSKPAPKPPASANPSSASPEVRAEWHRLLRAVSEIPKTEAAPAASRLRVTLARAALPQQPIEPDRPTLVLLGVLVASVAGVLAGLLRGWLEARAYRQYGIKTGAHPIAPLPQTTLRIPKNQLPKPLAPRSEPPPTPVPEAPPNAAPITPIPPAPLIPSPMITPIPPAAATAATAPITPIPVAPVGPAAATPVPTAAPSHTPVLRPGPEETPIPGRDQAPLVPVPPMVIAGPVAPSDTDAPPTTLPYPHPDPTPEPEGSAPKTRSSARRITQIYGTPPTPTGLQSDAKALRTTQGYGSPPPPIPPRGVPFSPTPIPAEVLPPHRNSLRPSPMIPLGNSSPPPTVAPSNRSGAPLAETGYSYVRTPVPEAHSIPQTPIPKRPDAIPQTPYPARPSPPPRTEPYGSLPPVQAKRPSSDPAPADPNRPKTPLPPPPEMTKPAPNVIRRHPVLAGWRPDPKLAPGLRREIAGEILTSAVQGCQVVGVTGLRGLGSEKSRAAVEIAFALSEAKHPRVLLVEGDFHFPQIQNWLKLEVPLAAGFSQQLRGRIQGTKEGRWHVVECLPTFHVLAEGVMRSPGLLLSNQFEQAMRELRSYYDIVVLDAPLAPNEADGQALVDVLDGIVVVAPENRAAEIAEVSRVFQGKKLVRALPV